VATRTRAPAAFVPHLQDQLLVAVAARSAQWVSYDAHRVR
jgi:hypothetical protein